MTSDNFVRKVNLKLNVYNTGYYANANWTLRINISQSFLESLDLNLLDETFPVFVNLN